MLIREIVWWAAFLAFNGAVAWCDFRVRRVPNPLVVAGLTAQALWLATLALLGMDPMVGALGFGDALAAFGIGALFVIFWKLRVMGAGDVKFLAALGLMLGVWPWGMVLLLAAVPSALHALAQIYSVVRNPVSSRRGIPYAGYLALAAASLALMPSSSPWCSWCSSWLSTGF